MTTEICCMIYSIDNFASFNVSDAHTQLWTEFQPIYFTIDAIFCTNLKYFTFTALYCHFDKRTPIADMSSLLVICYSRVNIAMIKIMDISLLIFKYIVIYIIS
mgnify:CR=1 FL=1